MLIDTLKYKCELNGIKCVIREESYTSKASFLDDDEIKNSIFSGTRITRGLYKSKNNYIHADVNGACNILRKEVPDIFNKFNKLNMLKTKSYVDKNLIKSVAI